jgi:predicted transposase/invertase (TIGR01784 family)
MINGIPEFSVTHRWCKICFAHLSNGDDTWNAPISFSELLYPSSIPQKYLPEFTYFKIAINEIPKRDLVKIRNAVAAIFYVENSTPDDIAHNRKELVSLLSTVLENEGVQLVRSIVDRIHVMHNIPLTSATIDNVEQLTEVSSMWETNVKKYYTKVREEAREQGLALGIEKGIEKGLVEGIEQGLEKGIEQGLEKGIEQGLEKGKIDVAERMLERGMSLEDIHAITGFTRRKIASLRKKGEALKSGSHPARRRIRAERDNKMPV